MSLLGATSDNRESGYRRAISTGALSHHTPTFFWAQAKKMPLTSSTPV